MELRSLQYFVEIADEGSLTRAADRIGVAQPALTRHLKRLEAELGAQLLTRLPRGVRLTAAGRDLLEHARRVLQEVGRARAALQGRSRTARGRVAMGTSPTLAPLLLPGCIARARQHCPSVALRVTEGFSPQLIDALLGGRLDLAVITNPPRSPALALAPLASEPIVVVVPPGARGTRNAFSLAELAKTPLIVTSGLRAIVEQQLERLGAGLRIEAEVDSIEAIRRLLLSGVGASVMPISAVHAEVSAQRLSACMVEDANLHRILVLARPVAEARSAAVNEIERIVRAEMSDLERAGMFALPKLRRNPR